MVLANFEEETKAFEELKADFEPLCKLVKEILGDGVEKCVVSERLTDAQIEDVFWNNAAELFAVQ